ncbi:MAG: hypothetical protein NWS00_02220, partial [Opitutales bacterium]|nr:hypothetical protein [Opitutales bacterium]
MIEGITAGFILSLTLFPGTVWLVKVGVCGNARQVLAVGFAFWFSQLLWMLVAIPGLMMMARYLVFIRPGMHLFAAFVLLFLGFKFFRTKRVEQLDDVKTLPSAMSLFRQALSQSFAMPMR